MKNIQGYFILIAALFMLAVFSGCTTDETVVYKNSYNNINQMIDRSAIPGGL